MPTTTRDMNRLAECSTCKAPILWARWALSGRAVPIDPTPVSSGNLALEAGRVHLYTDDDARLQRERFTSHFATCPDADQHRRRR